MSDMQPKNDRMQRAVTAGLSGVGATAGAAGLAYGLRDMRRAVKAGQKIPKMTKVLVPLEAAGLGGEIMATHILHNDTKRASQPTGMVRKEQESSKPMSRMNMDPKNGKGRRIVIENAESAEENKEENSIPVTRKKLLAMANDVKNGASMKDEVDKGWNPLSGLRLARNVASGEHLMDAARTERAIENGRTYRRYTEAQEKAGKASFQERKAERTANAVAAGHGPNASMVTPNGKTKGEREAALAASRAKREAGENVGAKLAGIEAPEVEPAKPISLMDRAKQAWKEPAVRTGTTLAAGGLTGGGLVAYSRKKHDPMDAYYGKARYFDPEADRQRRSGMYSGVLAGGSIAAGSQVHGRVHNATKIVDGKKLYGIRASKGGLIATGATLGLGMGAAAAYKHGISRRNMTWS